MTTEEQQYLPRKIITLSLFPSNVWPFQFMENDLPIAYSQTRYSSSLSYNCTLLSQCDLFSHPENGGSSFLRNELQSVFLDLASRMCVR
jgi:hypothetical protein